METLEERQTTLKDQYKFICRCEACTGDYPLFHDLKTTSFKFDRFMSNDVEMLQKLDVDRAKLKFDAYCEFIDEKNERYPCYEISALQECVLRCLNIFSMSEFNMKFL